MPTWSVLWVHLNNPPLRWKCNRGLLDAGIRPDKVLIDVLQPWLSNPLCSRVTRLWTSRGEHLHLHLEALHEHPMSIIGSELGWSSRDIRTTTHISKIFCYPWSVLFCFTTTTQDWLRKRSTNSQNLVDNHIFSLVVWAEPDTSELSAVVVPPATTVTSVPGLFAVLVLALCKDCLWVAIAIVPSSTKQLNVIIEECLFRQERDGEEWQRQLLSQIRIRKIINVSNTYQKSIVCPMIEHDLEVVTQCHGPSKNQDVIVGLYAVSKLLVGWINK